MTLYETVQRALAKTPPLSAVQHRLLFGCCRRPSDHILLARLKRLLTLYPALEPYLGHLIQDKSCGPRG